MAKFRLLQSRLSISYRISTFSTTSLVKREPSSKSNSVERSRRGWPLCQDNRSRARRGLGALEDDDDRAVYRGRQDDRAKENPLTYYCTKKDILGAANKQEQGIQRDIKIKNQAKRRLSNNGSQSNKESHFSSDAIIHRGITSKLPRKTSNSYTLSRRIEKRLAVHKLDEAIEIARIGYNNATVAWNLIIEYLMRAKKVSLAQKCFSEMSKRGSQPNERTFTILFKGLAYNADILPSAVDRCLKLITHMTSKLNTKEINIIHLNSALQVCSSAAQYNRVWEVLQAFDDLVKPDGQSYSIIFTALSRSAMDNSGLDEVISPSMPTLDSSNESSTVEPNDNLKRHFGRSNVTLSADIRILWTEAVEKGKAGNETHFILSDRLVLACVRALLKTSHRKDYITALRILAAAFNLPLMVKPWFEDDTPVIKNTNFKITPYVVPLVLEVCVKLDHERAYGGYVKLFRSMGIKKGYIGFKRSAKKNTWEEKL
ncbi:hypothetical protein V1511DRAFT_500612 [Dipodascopsis uninucleata]